MSSERNNDDSKSSDSLYSFFNLSVFTESETKEPNYTHEGFPRSESSLQETSSTESQLLIVDP